MTWRLNGKESNTTLKLEARMDVDSVNKNCTNRTVERKAKFGGILLSLIPPDLNIISNRVKADLKQKLSFTKSSIQSKYDFIYSGQIPRSRSTPALCPQGKAAGLGFLKDTDLRFLLINELKSERCRVHSVSMGLLRSSTLSRTQTDFCRVVEMAVHSPGLYWDKLTFKVFFLSFLICKVEITEYLFTRLLRGLNKKLT